MNNFSLNRGFPQKMYGVSLPHDVLPNCQAGSLTGYRKVGSVRTDAKASCVSLALFATAVISRSLPSLVKLRTMYKSTS